MDLTTNALSLYNKRVKLVTDTHNYIVTGNGAAREN